MAEKIPGVSQRKLIETIREAAEGKGRISKQQLGAARYLLDKLIPNAGRGGDDSEAANHTHYSEVRIVYVGGPGDAVQPAPAAGADPAADAPVHSASSPPSLR